LQSTFPHPRFFEPLHATCRAPQERASQPSLSPCVPQEDRGRPGRDKRAMLWHERETSFHPPGPCSCSMSLAADLSVVAAVRPALGGPLDAARWRLAVVPVLPLLNPTYRQPPPPPGPRPTPGSGHMDKSSPPRRKGAGACSRKSSRMRSAHRRACAATAGTTGEATTCVGHPVAG